MRQVRRSQTAVTESLVDRAHPKAERHSLRLGNRTEIGPLRGENPVRPGFIFLPWRRWNSQFNKLRRDGPRRRLRPGAIWFCCASTADTSWNHNAFSVFLDRVPVDESKPALFIVSVKANVITSPTGRA